MNTELKDNLSNIIDICKDGALGYDTAADNLKDTVYHTIFHRMAQQRKLFIEEVKEEANKLGVELETNGTTKGFFHRTWLSTKATFSPETIESVIDSAMRGEKEAVKVYEENINETIPAFLKEKLVGQLDLVKGAMNQLKGLELEQEPK